ncbi:MAG: 16S rRNA (uracil(1498)-N(3))-methyltransferase [Proteobacteria bacterium]|nr:16S rRNA (uracil(1498)-N(3))-methyltransferase [Pseudomonadota bacterium]
MPLLRLFVDCPLSPGVAVALAPAQAHYLGTVMRRGPGDGLLLFNGRDGEWRAEISDLKRRSRASVVVTEQTRGQAAEPDLWLLFAPVKRTPLDLIARCATELGVSALMPVITQFTVAKRLNIDRVRSIAMEAAEQCGRLTLPECAAPVTLDQRLVHWPSERRLLLCDESGGGAPVSEALGYAASGPWAVAIGPEGGFGSEEIDAMAAMEQTVRVSFGARILRAETAAVAALACWQALVGDWG